MYYVALLRGINVGGRTVRMSDLKACFDDMGFEDALTILQTGNVLFSSSKKPDALKRTIEAGLLRQFEYPARVQIFELSRLRAIVEASPYDDGDPRMHSYVVFFENGLEEQLMNDVALNPDIERIQMGDGVLYWNVPKGSTLDTAFAKQLVKKRFRDFHTTRNMTTLRKVIGEEPKD